MNPVHAAPLGIALLGLLLGMRHATDPDHVIAVTAILSREHRVTSAVRIGILWGFGHTLTVMLTGAAIIIFKIAIPARLELAMELAVAIALILLGSSAAARVTQRLLARVRKAPADSGQLLSHAHFHAHGGTVHSHPHVHVGTRENTRWDTHYDHRLPADQLPGSGSRRTFLRSFGMGLIHGLAGSAAIALLVLSAIPEPSWATLYLVIFCVGTTIGMGLITVAIATPLVFASRKVFWLHRELVTGSGLLSFGFGVFLAYRIGIVDHLFGTLVWTLR